MKAILLLLFIIFSSTMNAQPAKPCTAPEASQFAFWLGDWELTWNDTSKGSNSIHKVMDGCGVQENFSDPKTGFNGKSWSVYNPNKKIWQQTWIDNAGAYIALKGSFENGKMTLTTDPNKHPRTGLETISR